MATHLRFGVYHGNHRSPRPRWCPMKAHTIVTATRGRLPDLSAHANSEGVAKLVYALLHLFSFCHHRIRDGRGPRPQLRGPTWSGHRLFPRHSMLYRLRRPPPSRRPTALGYQQLSFRLQEPTDRLAHRHKARCRLSAPPRRMFHLASWTIPPPLHGWLAMTVCGVGPIPRGMPPVGTSRVARTEQSGVSPK